MLVCHLLIVRNVKIFIMMKRVWIQNDTKISYFFNMSWSYLIVCSYLYFIF